MKHDTDYNKYTEGEKLRVLAKEQARRFIEEETQFHLGGLPTEQAHPYTADFSATVQKDPAEGVRMLFSVDQELPSVARRVFLSGEFDALVEAFLRAVREEKRVCFSGCGSTGRLSIMLEEMWRGFWEDRSGAAPGDAEHDRTEESSSLEAARRSCSIMTGGDRALISSVEGFEDYEQFGARQVADLDLQPKDLFIAISEGGETSSVIGTAREALERGCQVFFVYSNPSALLVRDIERSRRLISDDRVITLDLFAGSMALSGSTRMQATTLEMLVVGAAMEEALLRSRERHAGDRLEAANRFARMLASFQEPANRRILGSFAQAEAEIYRAGGRVTYFADRFLLDIFCDTTERTPTFMLPAFRPFGDSTSPVSWAFAKDPTHDSESAWFRMLRRKPRGLSWTAEDYRAMNAPATLIDDPPVLDEGEIARYRIGSEDDPSRYLDATYLYISFSVRDSAGATLDDCLSLPGCTEGNHRQVIVASIDASLAGPTTPVPENAWLVSLYLPDSPINLMHHLAVKLLFNTVSTASMGIMGRIEKNWMVQVDCTNKKLVDRGSRIVAEIAGISYEDACYELHLSLLAKQEALQKGGSSTTSPVIAALERLDH